VAEKDAIFVFKNYILYCSILFEILNKVFNREKHHIYVSNCFTRDKVAEKEETHINVMAPIFTVKLDSITVEAGEIAKFMVKVSGHPLPTLSWWVDGVPAKNVRTRKINCNTICLFFTLMNFVAIITVWCI